MSAPAGGSAVVIDGPWTHRYVTANGSRFHVAEMGHGPMVLFLHGFPEFWYAWHRQLPALADAGYRAVAMDLRGYGASDKPPRGYDGFTLAADVAGLIRALGERDAVLVGGGFGGVLAFATTAFHPRLVRRLVVTGAAHPLRMRSALLGDPRGQLAAFRPVLRFQIPRYEHIVTKNDAAMVGTFLRQWGGADWVTSAAFPPYESTCRAAMGTPQAAFCALEAYRWALRSVLRPSGYRFVKLLQHPIQVPTLHLHGEVDPATLPRTAQGSGRYVTAAYEWRLLGSVGHFPHLEAPELVTGEILRWVKEDR